MDPVLESNSYGKGMVRVTRLTRHDDRHDIKQLRVGTQLFGDFTETYVTGDNKKIIATDTQRNTVYALASDGALESAEGFGRVIVAHFLKPKYPMVQKAAVVIEEDLYDRNPDAKNGGKPHPHSFTLRGSERRVAKVEATRDGGLKIQGGISGLSVLRSAGSLFHTFHRDENTVLPDSYDRIFATVVDCVWTYNDVKKLNDADFNRSYGLAREAIVNVFSDCDRKSLSVQQTLRLMGEEVLAACGCIETISFTLPNKHHVPFDLSRLGGRSNRNEVFATTDEPFGLIRGTVTRKRSAKL